MLAAGFIALPWVEDLANEISWPLAIWVVAGIALLPGYLAIWLWISLLIYRPRPLRLQREGWPDVRVLIAAYNEEDSLGDTLQSLRASRYPGILRVSVLDDGSDDRTAEAAEGAEVIRLSHLGKANALNRGLAEAGEEFCVVLDADTHVLPESIHRLVARALEEGSDCAAVAGAVLARNPHQSVIARMQQWDYHLGIASVKRSQALLGATLVAQGALSLYRSSFLRQWGWEKMVGEDIVLSWRILRQARIFFEPTAFALTDVPSSFIGFARQRRRWARGMIEGLRSSGREIFRQKSSARHGVFWAGLFPWVDSAYALAFVPGVFLAMSGNFIIVGLWTLLLLPLQGLLFGTQFVIQKRAMREVGYRHDSSPIGFILYLFLYQAILSPLSLWGYWKELRRHPKTW